MDIQIRFVTDHEDRATGKSKKGWNEGLDLLLHKTHLEGKRDFGCTCIWQQFLQTRGVNLKDLSFSVHLKVMDCIYSCVLCVGVCTQAHLFKHL